MSIGSPPTSRSRSPSSPRSSPSRRSSIPSSGCTSRPTPPPRRADLPELRGALDALKDEVLRRNAENRALLKRKMELVRAEIAGFRNPLASRASVYARQGGGALVDISG